MTGAPVEVLLEALDQRHADVLEAASRLEKMLRGNWDDSYEARRLMAIVNVAGPYTIADLCIIVNRLRAAASPDTETGSK